MKKKKKKALPEVAFLQSVVVRARVPISALAKESGHSHSMIYAMFRGDRQPTLKLFMDVAKQVGVKVSVFEQQKADGDAA